MSDKLSHENITITTQTLVALDQLQAITYASKFEELVREKCKHGESDIMEVSKQVLESFTYTAPAGNSHGIKMNSSAFVNGLALMGLIKEVEWAMQVITNE